MKNFLGICVLLCVGGLRIFECADRVAVGLAADSDATSRPIPLQRLCSCELNRRILIPSDSMGIKELLFD